MGDAGTELIHDYAQNLTGLQTRAAQSGAVLLDSDQIDPLLAFVLAGWPRLSASHREAIVANVQAALDRSAADD